MIQTERYDVVVLGSGQGGKRLAWHLGHAGKRVAVIERRWVGGSCPAVACMPSKNELWSAHVAHLVRNAGRFGTVVADVRIDIVAVKARKQAMVDREIAFHLQAYKDSGAELVMGEGHFTAPKTLYVTLNDGGTRELVGDAIVLNLGSHAAIPVVPGLEQARPLTHIEALELDAAPHHLIVLGGGYTGLELAQAFHRFGSRITVIEPGPQIMSREDEDVAAEMERLLSDDGIEILKGVRPVEVEGLSGDAVRLEIEGASGMLTVEGSHLLVATGRIPNTAGIGLDVAGVTLDRRGFIEVDEQLRTTAPDIWAIGECAGSPQFTHVSVDDFRIVLDAMAGGRRRKSDRLIPSMMFTDPPLAHVGLSELEAQRSGIAVRVATLPMRNVLRTSATDETNGFMKVLVGVVDDLILGFTMIGADADGVMAAVQTAMLARMPYPRLRDAVFTHLTAAEGLGPLLERVPALHG